MTFKFPKDKRDRLWARLEKDIQSRGLKKQKGFSLSGKWKRFAGMHAGFKVYAVDVEWVKDNLSVIFGHGGHGFVHEFIPNGEIWIATHHYPGCGCRNVRKDRKVSPNYFESCTVHEITEFGLMKKGMSYWRAHNLSLEAERKLGLLKDPNTEVKS
jgi:hypothetical protein